jgi:ribonuclease HII
MALASRTVSRATASRHAWGPVLGVDEAGRGAALGDLACAGAVLRRADAEALAALGVRDSKLVTSHARRAVLAREIRRRSVAWRVVRVPAAAVDRAVWRRRRGPTQQGEQSAGGEDSDSLVGAVGLNELERHVMLRLVAALVRDAAVVAAGHDGELAGWPASSSNRAVRSPVPEIFLDAVDKDEEKWGQPFRDALRTGLNVETVAPSEGPPADLISTGARWLAGSAGADDLPQSVEDISEAVSLPRLTGVEVVSKHRADQLFSCVSAASILAKVARDEALEQYQREHETDFGTGYSSDPKTVDFLRQLVASGDELPPFVRQSWKTLERVGE